MVHRWLMRTAIVVVLCVVMALPAWHVAQRVLQTVSTRQARKQLEDLRELVTAWQLANGDEVEVMNQRVADAQESMAAAEQAARVSASHLASIEDSWTRESG